MKLTQVKDRAKGVNVAGPNTHLPPHWQDRVVWGLDGTPNEQTYRFLTAQQRAEGGNAKWNPCNCSLWIQNFTDLPNYNDIPVRNYSYPNVGVAAHVLTLTQHTSDGKLKYAKLYNELQNAVNTGRTAEQMVENCRSDLVMWSGGNQDYPDLILSVLKNV